MSNAFQAIKGPMMFYPFFTGDVELSIFKLPNYQINLIQSLSL
jgi:hypothetical protein